MRTFVNRNKKPKIYFGKNGTVIDISHCITAHTPDYTQMVDGQPKMLMNFQHFSPWTENVVFDMRHLGLKMNQIQFPIEVIVGCNTQAVNTNGIGPIQIRLSDTSSFGSKYFTAADWHEIYLGQMNAIGHYATKVAKKSFTSTGGQSWGDNFNYLSVGVTRQGSYSTITGITKANPARATCSNGFTEGQTIGIGSIGGMTQINDKKYKVVNRDANGFDLYNEDNSPVDSTGYSTFTGNGYAFANTTTQYTLYPPIFGRIELGAYFCLTADDWELSHGDMWDYAKLKGVPITFYLTPGADNSTLWSTYQRIKSEADTTYNAMWGKQMVTFCNHGADINTYSDYIASLNSAAATLAAKGLGTEAYRHIANVNGFPTYDQTKLDTLKANGYVTNRSIRKFVNYASTVYAYPDSLLNLYCVAQGANPVGNHTYSEIATNISAIISHSGGMAAALVHKTAANGDSNLTVAMSEFQRMVDYVAANKDIQCITIPDWYSRITTGKPAAY